MNANRFHVWMAAALLAACGSPDSAVPREAEPTRPIDRPDEPRPNEDEDEDTPWTPLDLPPQPSCDDDDRPARCDIEPEEYVWGDALVVTGLRMLGTEWDPECCVDMNAIEGIDNSLGQNVAGFGESQNYNRRIGEIVETGADTVVLELGERDKPRVSAQWWRARWAVDQPEDGPVRTIVRHADDGVQSRSSIEELTPTDDGFHTVGGRVELPFMVFALVWVESHLVDLTIEAAEEPGHYRARLSGAVEVVDYFAKMNEVLATCECLGLSEPAIAPETGMCSEQLDPEACQQSGETQCAVLGGACSIYGATALFADVDLDDDGLNEAVSFAYELDLAPAQIVDIERLGPVMDR